MSGPVEISRRSFRVKCGSPGDKPRREDVPPEPAGGRAVQPIEVELARIPQRQHPTAVVAIDGGWKKGHQQAGPQARGGNGDGDNCRGTPPTDPFGFEPVRTVGRGDGKRQSRKKPPRPSAALRRRADRPGIALVLKPRQPDSVPT